MDRLKAKPIARVITVKGVDTLDIYAVEDTLSCKSEKALQLHLDFYCRPFPKMYLPVDDPFRRRHHVEKIRPALRWWCRVFGRPVPDWLQGNGIYDDLPQGERDRLYGPRPLNVIEFEPAVDGTDPDGSPAAQSANDHYDLDEAVDELLLALDGREPKDPFDVACEEARQAIGARGLSRRQAEVLQAVGGGAVLWHPATSRSCRLSRRGKSTQSVAWRTVQALAARGILAARPEGERIVYAPLDLPSEGRKGPGHGT